MANTPQGERATVRYPVPTHTGSVQRTLRMPPDKWEQFSHLCIELGKSGNEAADMFALEGIALHIARHQEHGQETRMPFRPVADYLYTTACTKAEEDRTVTIAATTCLAIRKLAYWKNANTGRTFADMVRLAITVRVAHLQNAQTI